MNHNAYLHPQPVGPSDPLCLSNVLLQDVYRQLGHQYPDRLFARIMNEEETNVKFIDITWGQLMREASGVANILNLSRIKNPLSKTIGILGPSNYQYYVNIVACWVSGWSVILLSTRNSVPALESLLKAVNACALLVDPSSQAGIELGKLIPNLVIMPICDLQPEVLANGAVSGNYTTPRRTDSEMDTPIIYVHTSGSQGHPKPIQMTHRHVLRQIRLRDASKYAGVHVYAPVPLFHGMGLYAFTRWPIGSGIIPVFIMTKRPLDGETLLRHTQLLPGCLCFIAPSLLEEVTDNPLSSLTGLQAAVRVCYAGAPIRPDAAEKLVKAGVPLISAYGASEAGLLTVVDFPSDDNQVDSSYMRFRENQFILHFVPVDDNPDVTELIILPDSESSPAVLNCEEPFVGYATRDLWAPHPTKSGLWKHLGRRDDLTVLSNGEKTNNKQLEKLLLEDRQIHRVVVFGTGRLLNGVIIEPKQIPSKDETDSFIDSIWATIERTNATIPKHSRLIREMVLIADRDKPFSLTDKGTIRSKETVSLYDSEIKAAYMALENNSNDITKAANVQDLADIKRYVRDVVYRSLSSPIGDDVDFFDSGMDSLHAVQIRLGMIPLFKLSGTSVPKNLVYQYPTISMLVDYASTYQLGVVQEDSRAAVEDCLRRFTNQFSTQRVSEAHTIVLTGSTGSLGCHLLVELLLNDDVSRIICLHRGAPETAMQRHISIFKERNIPVDILDRHGHKIEFITIDLSVPSLGLDSRTLEMLHSQVTHIIHTAWELNFNWKLERFERVHIAGVRHLVDFAMASARQPRFVFISSIGAVGRAPSPVPEQAITDPSSPGEEGYGQAKFVAERIVDEACKHGLRATIIRAGQLSGSTIDGYWARTEFIPTLLRTSRKLGVIPDLMPETRWIPTDIAAKCVLDLCLHKNTSQLSYYHVENSTPTPWDEVVKLYIEAVNGAVKVIPTSQWLDLVEKTGESDGSRSSQDIPALALLHFYHKQEAAGRNGSTAVLSTRETCQVCPMVDFGPVTLDLMRKYVQRIG